MIIKYKYYLGWEPRTENEHQYENMRNMNRVWSLVNSNVTTMISQL